MGADSVRGHFLWNELMTTDTQAAVAFYSKVIGWEQVKWDQDPGYTVLAYKGSPMAGVRHLPPEARAMGAPPSWLVYIGTPDVNVTAWEAQRLGAKLLKGPETTPTVGRWAVLQDPQGAVFAAYTPERPPKLGGDPGIGDFSWYELATTNHVTAFAFYQKLFGWKKTGSFDRGSSGTYLMFGGRKKSVAGVYTKGKDAPGPPAWLPYARVPDVKPTAKLIAGAGGTIINAPMEVPDGTWIAVGKDPQGAVFAVHSVPKKAKPARKPAARKAPKGGKKVIRRTVKTARKAKISTPKSKPKRTTEKAKKRR